MPPDYELQSYWKTRFVGEQHFEWLGDGKDTILPHVRAFLGSRPSSGSPARLLHIGAGTSSLSERLRELYIDVYGDSVDEGAIVNADFVEDLVARKQATEEARRAVGGPGKGMSWVRMDALEWPELNGFVDTNGGLFDLVVEKSTSDAISCGEDLSYGVPGPSLHPVFNDYLKTHAGRTFTLSPVEVLAIHLASLVRTGGLWVALTFSSNRFPFLSSPEIIDGNPPRATDFWSLEKVVTMDAPTGAQSNVHAPVVQHYVYLIRRKA
ncbi:uncharacterized protein TRAVEDRAFT_25445 [Trametes versicolor FP-101664 SS1]|uniref:uncharacterized protein n=1 Tax=Trametes versicolor (strain FP-101664) TaxID=717944 RepID=UPI00046249D9|nr:uncharacterized protein TRAVEDRAFT_25445 [Trametes versicolor FP-101664 SS1]EIW64185.1 hypothetical protein TRAVEDRAFT_25445 [Trametes versicolor FP-101664 SS1]